MAAPLQPGPRPFFELGAAKMLFAVRALTFVPQSNAFSYSVASVGQRFLVNTLVRTAEPTLNVIVNWEKAVAGGAQ